MLLRVCHLSQEIRLTLPRRAGASEALGFLAAQHGWMLRSMERNMAPPRPFAWGAGVPVAGETLHIVEGHGRAIVRDGGLLRVPGPEWRVNARVALWLRREAGRLLDAESRALADRLGRPLASVSVRDPRSRWGSCSSAGSITYSWRLILAPEFVRRAVVAHEVAHLAEPHHGPSFWRLAEELLGASHTPARQWLRANAASLHAWGRAG
jgi:predicted metal-dependent hydrolase